MNPYYRQGSIRAFCAHITSRTLSSWTCLFGNVFEIMRRDRMARELSLALDSDSNQESEPRSKNFTMSHVFCCSTRECESRLETLSEKWHNVTRNTPHDMSLHRSNHGESEVKFRATQARYCLKHFETAKKHVLQTLCGPMSECASPA